VTLSVILLVGVLGALLFNTSMQQQARLIAGQRAHLSALQLTAQSAQTRVDQSADPWLLARRARALHMKQTTSVTLMRMTQRTVTGKRARPRRLIRPFHSG
jgi:hypothetical protein